ncbi:MAG TPA: sterol desaturase family protein [Candidatus Binatus sp.]|nr:sterol desaturase family protein [Candidatus Binatus sp.]
MSNRPLPLWLSGAVVGGTFVVLLALELFRPLRRAVEPKRVRLARNFAVAALGAAAVSLTERPVINHLAASVGERRWGVLGWTSLPLWVEIPLAVALMDYTLYVWHFLVHRVPWLWRFHVVHHTDLDMDASTAVRFHFAELVISIPWRAAQVVLIGVSPLDFSIWQTALLVSTMFHHSNVRLPETFERRLARFVVTPRMHGIHHSVVREETDSNWSSGLAVWDRLHGTFRLDVPQENITIGVPAYRAPEDVRLASLLRLPFVPQRPSWRWHGTHGTVPRTSARSDP